ncbi:pyridoxal phosphate-dependent decarboxylase family protein [Streptomyces sp. BE303]|uniref:pyridoxal phosphate-dependent decarboxylase family protein n=1 Tax=Streptomyces sp. BE303 TaxID=3002528 RepID=UPI002E79C451|nr:pyridoxal-dependent decarboxylase [Streptomyces sp. BE303]MED7952164.1 pyridoxal-dependent decarboxylase [Streptomyces sp. BE303]
MHPRLGEDLDRLRELLDAVSDRAAHVLAGIGDRPVVRAGDGATGAPGAGLPLPVEGSGADGALKLFAERWEPGFSGSAGPRYLGFVTGGVTPAALAGDWLTSAFDQNVSNRIGSAAADLEQETLGWLRSLFGLSEAHTGVFVSGATMSNLVGLAVAREWVGEQRGVSVTRDGLAALGPVEVLSGAAHSSIGKALSVLGLGRGALRRVRTLEGREAVDVGALADELASLEGRPAVVVANAGTVNTVDFDDLQAIAALREQYPFWLHVDAAFGAFAALSPAHEHLVAALDAADSVCVDLHKWLNVPYDAAVQFTRRQDLQIAAFHNTSPYLGAPTADPDPVHLAPENSRRLRALPTWFALTAYGRTGHREIVERTCTEAARLGAALAAEPAFRLLAPVRLNVVCFTLAGRPAQDDIDALLRRVAASGEAFLTPTVLDGVPAVRAAFSNWRTTGADTDRVLAALRAAAAAH